jgi:hypothetical protein
VNNDAVVRRQLCSQFIQDEEHPGRFQNIHKYVKLEVSYWMNERTNEQCVLAYEAAEWYYYQGI